jgi:hypothetical protein
MVSQSRGNRSQGKGDAKGHGKIEIETEGTTRTLAEGYRLPGTTDTTVRNREQESDTNKQEGKANFVNESELRQRSNQQDR